MKRLEGGDVIPPLEEGAVEEELTVEDWLYSRSTSYKQKDMKEFERVVGKKAVPVVE